jgi:molybdate transport system substrate-binding protein
LRRGVATGNGRTIPDFEKSSGHKVTITYGTAGAIAERARKEAADIVISSVPLIEQLQAQGKVVLAAARKGAVKPDISSADAFKRSMLAARSIACPDPAGGGASLVASTWPACSNDWASPWK